MADEPLDRSAVMLAKCVRARHKNSCSPQAIEPLAFAKTFLSADADTDLAFWSVYDYPYENRTHPGRFLDEAALS